jgi:hypothetical protein
VLRFGKMLVFPLLVFLSTARPTLLGDGRIWTSLLDLGLLSNFAFA